MTPANGKGGGGVIVVAIDIGGTFTDLEEPHPRKPEFVTSAKFGRIRNTLYGLVHDEIRKDHGGNGHSSCTGSSKG